MKVKSSGIIILVSCAILAILSIFQSENLLFPNFIQAASSIEESHQNANHNHTSHIPVTTTTISSSSSSSSSSSLVNVEELKRLKSNLQICNEQLSSSLSNKPSETKEQTVKPSPQESKFDDIAKDLYHKAIISTSNSNKQARVPFTLEGWERGTGGLDDQDRLALGALYFQATSVFEFGLGESTYIAANVSVPRYAGVDSDANWVADARNKVALMNAKHFRFHFADIGETKAWGHPVERLAKNLYNYQIQSLASEQSAFDVYYVDGRYRVACACISFLHALKYGANMTHVRVGIHDNERKAYHALEQIGDVVVRNKKLWVYRLKDGVTEDDIVPLYHKHLETLLR